MEDGKKTQLTEAFEKVKEIKDKVNKLSESANGDLFEQAKIFNNDIVQVINKINKRADIPITFKNAFEFVETLKAEGTSLSLYGPSTLVKIEELNKDAKEISIQVSRYQSDYNQWLVDEERKQKEEEELRKRKKQEIEQEQQKIQQQQQLEKQQKVLEMEEEKKKKNVQFIDKESIKNSAKEIKSDIIKKDHVGNEKARLNPSLIGKEVSRAKILDVISTQPNSKKCLKSLVLIVERIVKNPENDAFRRLRVRNVNFENDIRSFQGGCEFLVSVGFRVRYSPTSEDNDDSYTSSQTVSSQGIDDIEYFNPEPSINDFDGWSDWHDNLKQACEDIKNYINNLS